MVKIERSATVRLGDQRRRDRQGRVVALYDHLQAAKWIFVQWAKSLAPKAIVEILGIGLNLAEEAIDFVRTKTNVVDGEGLTLEKIGQKFGVARGGMTDAVYRAAIIVEARSLFASGDSAAILGMMMTLLPDAVLNEAEFYPHVFVMYVQNADLEMLNILGQLLEDVPALTVNGNLVWVDDEVPTFGSVEGSVAVPAGIAGCWGSVEGPVAADAGMASAIPIWSTMPTKPPAVKRRMSTGLCAFADTDPGVRAPHARWHACAGGWVCRSALQA